MLTLIESISLAGDRAKQNDDDAGILGRCAWIIDGATDLHDAPRSRYGSDAAWIAQRLNSELQTLLSPFEHGGADEAALRTELAYASQALLQDYVQGYGAPDPEPERWKLPTASILMVSELGKNGIVGLDLGDCRCFALDACGAAHAVGGPPFAADHEMQAAAVAARQTGRAPLLRDPNTMALLRDKRAQHNTSGNYWVFGLQPECAAHARYWTLELQRPAHILLCTDGFAALADRYGVYDPAALVRAAVDKGVQELGRELRVIESSDESGARFPRWKPSDDATALLLRLD